MFLKEEFRGKILFFVGIDKVRFKKVVKSGDVFVIEIELIFFKGLIGKVKVVVIVDGEVVCEGELFFVIK